MTMFTRKEKIRARVILADDHPAILEDLQTLLKQEFEVVATVGDGNALIAAAETLAPDVIVTDIAMPGLNGMTAAADILRSNPDARIVFVSAYNDPVLVKKGLATGAFAYVSKLRAGEDLVPAIHAALRGEHHLSPTVGAKRSIQMIDITATDELSNFSCERPVLQQGVH